MIRLLTALDRLVGQLLQWLVVAALAGVLVLVTLGILARSLPVLSVSGYDEVIELLVAWMTFAGGVALWREGTLFRVDLLGSLLPRPLGRGLTVVMRALMLIFALVFSLEGWRFTAGAIETTPFLLVSKRLWYAAMPASGLLMTIYALVDLVRPRPAATTMLPPRPPRGKRT
jgi:TRAP-type C4-dicarboxylate transport system permease small subunit